MKFAYAWTFAGEPRGEPSAPPPGKRAPAFPRLPACRALFRQTGKRILRAMLAVFRTGRRQPLALGEHAVQAFHTSPPSQNGTTAACHAGVHRTRHALEICIGQRSSHGAHRLTPAGLFLLVGGFKNWFGLLEQRVAIQRGLPGARRQPLPPNPAPPAPTERCSTRPTSRHRPRPIHCRAPPAPRPARKP